MKLRLARAALVALLVVLPVAAAEATATETGVTGGLLQAVVGLAVVLALIWGAAWLMRRLQPHMSGSAGPLRLIATQSVGQRERIVVVEIAEQWLVVGVAPGSINALATLAKGALPPAAATERPFAALLARARGQREAQ